MPLQDVQDKTMRLELSEQQVEERLRFRSFAAEHIQPNAAQWDMEQRISPQIIDQLRGRGYLGAPVAGPSGQGMDAITYGLLTEEIGRACSSVRSLLTVHDMVAFGLMRWGSAKAKDEFGAAVRRGDLLGALALSEPDIGSDAAGVTTQARLEGNEYILDGTKKWITFGQIADLLVVLARYEDKPTAFLVPSATEGVVRTPIYGIAGMRASQLAQIRLTGCRIPEHYLLGRAGLGFSHVVSSMLDLGRYSVAWGSIGIAQACLDAALDYTSKRKQFGTEIRQHQLVRRRLTEMIASTRAARLLCYRAGYLRNLEDPEAAPETLIAKYFAAKTAVRVANDAVHLHGANGVYEAFPVARYLRDAKVTEIIEGTTEIMQITIAKYPHAEL